MKYLQFVIIVCLISLSCKQEQKKQDTSKAAIHSFTNGKANTIIKGKIENLPNNFVVLSSGNFTDTTYLKNNAEFQFALNIKTATYFLLKAGKSNIKLFIEPEKDVFLSFKHNQELTSIVFEGEGALANKYMVDKYLLMLDNALPVSGLYNLPFKDFKYKTDSLYVVSKMFLDAYAGKKQLPEVFISTELATLKYERAAKLLEYLTFNNKPIANGPDSALKFMDELSLNEPKHLFIYEYRLFLNAYINYAANEKLYGKNLYPHEIALIKMQTTNQHIQNQKVKDHVLYTLIKEHIKYYGYKNTDLLFKTFELNCKTPEYLTPVLNAYKNYKKLSEKTIAPYFEMQDTDGKTLSINSFKGSYLYIDVWASWCIPCRKEAPFFDELKQKYQNKNVVFLSLSVDKTTQDWLTYLENRKKENSGHYWLPEAKSFLDNYMIKTIPHFIIIDDKGQIIDSNAARPSEGKNQWLEELPAKPNA